MRKILFIIILLTYCLTGTIQSQLSIQVHIGSPPQWGPEGHSEARYYYLPDIETYYDVQTSRFIYFNGVYWVQRAYLPPKYRNYDLYGAYKVVITSYNGNRPYSHFSEHKSRYGKGYRMEHQRNIGQRPENRRMEKPMEKRPKQQERYSKKDHKQHNEKQDHSTKSRR